MYKRGIDRYFSVTIYSVRFNGNNPSRHAEFLRALREQGVGPFFTIDMLDPYAPRPRHRRLPHDAFTSSLVTNADVCISAHPDDGIEVTAAVARLDEFKDVIWTARYAQPYTPARLRTLRDLVGTAYGYDLYDTPSTFL